MVLHPSGIRIDSSSEQPWNAQSPMVSRELGSTTYFNISQPSKARFSIFVQTSGIIIASSAEQPLNISSGRIVRFTGSLTYFKLQHPSKTCDPIDFKREGNLTPVKDMQSWNTQLPISFTVSGITTDSVDTPLKTLELKVSILLGSIICLSNPVYS